MAKKTTATTPAPKSTAKPAGAKPAAKAAAKPTAAKPAKKGAVPAPAPTPAAKAPVVTLKQLAAKLGEAHSLPPRQAQALLDTTVGLLVEHLKAGDKLRLAGLGILEVKNRPARTARNPATGEAVQVAASKKIAFRPAKELKEAI